MSNLAPLEWLIEDLCTTIIDASPEELPALHSKLQALALSIQDRLIEKLSQPTEGGDRE